MGSRLLLVLGSVLYIASLASATSLGKRFNVVFMLSTNRSYATGYYYIGLTAAAKRAPGIFPGNLIKKASKKVTRNKAEREK